MASILNAFKAAIDPGVNTITGKVKALNRLLDQIEPLIDTLKASNPSQAQLSEVQAYVIAKIKEIDTSHTGVNERVTAILQKLNPGGNNGATNAELNAAYANVQQQRALNTSYPTSGSVASVGSLLRNSSVGSTGNASSVASTNTLQNLPNPYENALNNARAAEEAQAALENALGEYAKPIPGLLEPETDSQIRAIEQITGLNSSSAANASLNAFSQEQLKASATEVEQTLPTTKEGSVTGVEESMQGGMDVKGVKVAPLYSGIARFIPFVQNNWGSTARVTSPPGSKYIKVQYKFEDKGDEKTVYFYKDDATRIIIEDIAKNESTVLNALGRPEVPQTTIFERVTGFSLLNDEAASSENKYKLLLHTTWGSFGFRLPTTIPKALYTEKSKQFQNVVTSILELEEKASTKGGRRIVKRSCKKTRKAKKSKKRSTRK